MESSSPWRPEHFDMEVELTPRSKVAKMLADIDSAPTPSPPPLAPSESPGLPAQQQIVTVDRDESPVPDRSIPEQRAPFLEDSGSDEDDVLDAVRRPKGRAAQRMHPTLGSSPPSRPTRGNVQGSDDELYSTTPLRPSKRTVSAHGSPAGGHAGNGLFVSPAKSGTQLSDDELPTKPWQSTMRRLKNKRGRNSSEIQDDRANETQMSAANTSDLPEDAIENPQDPPMDPAIEKIMSDASRPARKASKKALLEMERETQRLSRQQALAHQMRVKKKFNTDDLFAKFNFRRPGSNAVAPPEQQNEGETTASSAPNSDGPEERSKEPVSTPPSSPPTPLDRQKALVEQGALSKLVPVRQDSIASLAAMEDDEDLPDMADLLSSSQPRGPIVNSTVEVEQPKKGLKLARLGKGPDKPSTNDSDDELDIVQTLPRRAEMFEKALGTAKKGRPADSKAIHALKHLSHIVSRELQPTKKGSRPSIAPDVLEAQLRRRAREQARQLQLERIEELKAKGIDVQTNEEREKEAEAFEDLLEKARQDAVSLRKAEKAARKEAGGEAAVEISDDEDEDEEYIGSGSEAEDVEEEGGEDETDGNDLVDEVAEETDEEEEQEEAAAEDDEDELNDDVSAELDIEPAHDADGDSSTKQAPAVPRGRKSRVILDDEDDESDFQSEVPAALEKSAADNDPFAAFNFGAANQVNPLMSPTQAFNATMQTPTQATQEDSFDILRHLAPPSSSSVRPSLPDLDTQDEDESHEDSHGSQVPESQRITLDWETQMPETPVPAGLSRGPSALSETPGWEPTQDRGLESPWSVRQKAVNEDIVESPVDYETQSTLNLRVSESPAPSQVVQRRGKLGRRRMPIDEESDDEPDVASVTARKRDAFREMARRRKEALTAAEKADVDKEMRGMMDEQAEESEDEYAGLGGDDFVAPETEQDREMIDSSHVEVDEREIAAHFAERERMRMEEETSKLYKDLTTGMLRRKMASNAFDLEEDEDEIAARRRQMRQLEETKKRKALLKDENIAHLADGKPSKGREAFLRAIADDDGDDDGLELAATQADSAAASQDDSTQSQNQPSTAEPLREIAGNKRKATGGDSGHDARPPAKQRRTEAPTYKRPTSLLEVKESVSFLLEDSNPAVMFGPSVLEPSSDPENDDEVTQQDEKFDNDDEVETELARQNDGGHAPNPASFDAKAMPPPRLPASQRRTAAKPVVVDRLSLKRASSNGYESAHGRTAWAAGPTTGGFKNPSLLHRATTNTATNANDRGVSTPNLSREHSAGMKMGGSKKSSLAYQARAEERKAIVEASAKRREENTARIAQMRRNSSVLSRGLTGRFE